jgi:hypothetical protein
LTFEFGGYSAVSWRPINDLPARLRAVENAPEPPAGSAVEPVSVDHICWKDEDAGTTRVFGNHPTGRQEIKLNMAS